MLFPKSGWRYLFCSRDRATQISVCTESSQSCEVTFSLRYDQLTYQPLLSHWPRTSQHVTYPCNTTLTSVLFTRTWGNSIFLWALPSYYVKVWDPTSPLRSAVVAEKSKWSNHYRKRGSLLLRRYHSVFCQCSDTKNAENFPFHKVVEIMWWLRFNFLS